MELHETPASLDRWLRFDARTAARYEEEHGPERVAHLRHAIIVGVILYNLYNLTAFLLTRDLFWETVAARVLLFTPVSLSLVVLTARVGSVLREQLVTFGMMNAFLIPVLIFWASQDHLASYTFLEFPLTLVFGNMLLALRFRHAVLFTLFAGCITMLAIQTKPGLDPGLRFAFSLQIVTACLFTLYANFLVERRRCTDYLRATLAVLRAEKAEINSEQLLEITKTDVLTGLPNRRHLDDRLNAMLATDRAVAVMMIDVDHFKLFNDTLGHPAGDDCLRSIATLFERLNRRPDTLCGRFGGEEFTVAVMDETRFGVARLAGDIVRQVRELGIAHPGRNDGLAVVTVSIGVAQRPGGSTLGTSALLAEADAALYQAKRRGRNGYVIADAVSRQRMA